MKSKKLISLLCAAAMSASAFAGLTVTASAATDLVTLDGLFTPLMEVTSQAFQVMELLHK